MSDHNSPFDRHDCIDWNSGGACLLCRRFLSIEEQTREIGDPMAKKKKARGVEVEFEGGEGDALTITLRGPSKMVVGVLVNGMPPAALVKLSSEIDEIAAKRTARGKR